MTELEKFVAKVNATSFLHDDLLPEGDFREDPRTKKLKAILARLSRRQQEMLLGSIEGWVTIASIGGRPYALKSTTVGWTVVCLSQGAQEEHTVDAELKECSCERSRLSGEVCKHILELRRVVG